MLRKGKKREHTIALQLACNTAIKYVAVLTGYRFSLPILLYRTPQHRDEEQIIKPRLNAANEGDVFRTLANPQVVLAERAELIACATWNTTRNIELHITSKKCCESLEGPHRRWNEVAVAEIASIFPEKRREHCLRDTLIQKVVLHLSE